MHDANQDIPDTDIKCLARWRSIENMEGKKANVGGTKEGYSDIMMMLKSLSQGLTYDSQTEMTRQREVQAQRRTPSAGPCHRKGTLFLSTMGIEVAA
jgi:hypothetical protein